MRQMFGGIWVYPQQILDGLHTLPVERQQLLEGCFLRFQKHHRNRFVLELMIESWLREEWYEQERDEAAKQQYRAMNAERAAREAWASVRKAVALCCEECRPKLERNLTPAPGDVRTRYEEVSS